MGYIIEPTFSSISFDNISNKFACLGTAAVFIVISRPAPVKIPRELQRNLMVVWTKIGKWKASDIIDKLAIRTEPYPCGVFFSCL